MVMTLEELRTHTDKTIKRLHQVTGLAIGLSSRNPWMTFDLNVNGKLLFQRKDYPALLELLRVLASCDIHPKYSMQWSSWEKVLFSWESESVTVWLVVDPDKVPEELMGPECRLVKTVNQDVQYSMVCER